MANGNDQIMTDEDIRNTQKTYAEKTKSHKRWRLGLTIAGAVLIGAGLVVATPLVAAYGPAWWALNGPLTFFGVLGLGAAGIARFLDRKNIGIVKVLDDWFTLRSGDIDQRTKEIVQNRYNNNYNKYEKYLPENLKFSLQKLYPAKTGNQTGSNNVPDSSASEPVKAENTNENKKSIIKRITSAIRRPSSKEKENEQTM